MRLTMGILATIASLLGLGCGKSSSARYTMATDLGSRHSSRYVHDRVTGKWVYREIELRVGTARHLPDPISDDEHGDRLSLQLFRPLTVQTGGLRKGTAVIEGGYRVWRGADVVNEGDLEGRAAYGVTVEWPVVDDSSGAPYDPLEIFQMPPFGETEPEAWSPWMTAAKLREVAPKYPFEFRWRLKLDEVPGRLP
jgi:hypothetical protein